MIRFLRRLVPFLFVVGALVVLAFCPGTFWTDVLAVSLAGFGGLLTGMVGLAEIIEDIGGTRKG